MRTSANNSTGIAKKILFPESHQYQELKVNKNSTIYQLVSLPKISTWLTSLIKIEDFQGYSKGQNFNLYFRLRDQSSWKKSEAVTGLFRTSSPGVYFGNRKHQGVKTLVMFKLSETGEKLTIYTFPASYYPSRTIVDRIAFKLYQ